jgi:hypothetical protein
MQDLNFIIIKFFGFHTNIIIKYFINILTLQINLHSIQNLYSKISDICLLK